MRISDWSSDVCSSDLADRQIALDLALDDQTAGDIANHRTAEYIAHLRNADDLFARLGAEQARNGAGHVVDDLVDDRVVADVDTGILDTLARSAIGADVEADDDRLRCDRQLYIRIVEATERGRQIGRASCGERCLKYSEIQGVA